MGVDFVLDMLYEGGCPWVLGFPLQASSLSSKYASAIRSLLHVSIDTLRLDILAVVPPNAFFWKNFGNSLRLQERRESLSVGATS